MAATAHLFERAHQIAGLDRALRITCKIQIDSTPKQLVSKLHSQRVQNEAAFFIEVPIEQIERRVVRRRDDRTPITPGRFSQIRIEIVLHAELVLVAAQMFFTPHVLEIRGEALVQPTLRPIAARDVIAEPLMRELVRDEIVAAHVE
jgi:hypothetical protein